MYDNNRLIHKLNIPTNNELLSSDEVIYRLSNFGFIVDLELRGDMSKFEAVATLIKDLTSMHIDDFFYFTYDKQKFWITINFYKEEHLTLFKISEYFGVDTCDVTLKEIKFKRG